MPETSLTRALLLLTLSPLLACASPAAPAPTYLSVTAGPLQASDLERPGLPQYPALDPTGAWLTFAHAGDIWIVESDGGVAQRLTAHPATERRSAFSPDGSLLAFESDRDGARNLYLLPLTYVGSAGEGDGRVIAGPERRVTFTDRSETLGSFTADGERLLFHSSREPGMYRSARLFQVPVDGGPIERLTDAFGHDPRAGLDGRVVFRRGRDLLERPVYRGPGTPSLWELAPDADLPRPRVESEASEHAGHPLPDGGLLFLSSRSGSNQVWHEAPDGSLRRLTDFRPAEGEPTIGHGVRDLRVAPGGAAATFCVWDRIYTLDLSGESPQVAEVQVLLSADDATPERIVLDLDREVDEAVLSPDGRTVAIAARGDVFVRSVEEGRPTRRVTGGEARDGDLAWAPDGSVLYFVTDASGYRAIHAAEVALTRSDLEPEEVSEDDPEEGEATDADSAGDSDEEQAADEDSEDEGADDEAEDEDDGPDHGARWAGALTFTTREVVAEDGMELWGPTPSPDGRSLLYHRERGDLLLLDLASGTSRTVLEGWDEPVAQWAADSRHVVYYVADLDFNNDVWIGDVGPADATDWTFEPVNLTRHPDNDVDPQLSADGRVLVFLSERAGENWSWDVWRVNLDATLDGLSDYELEEHFERTSKALAKRKSPADGGEVPEPFELDLEDAWLRPERITSLPGSEGELAISPAGDRIYFEGAVGEDRGYWSVDHGGDDREQVVPGSVSGVHLTPDGDWIGYVSGGQARRVKSGGGKPETLDIDARAEVDVAAQQRQKFREAARVLEFSFYHPTLKDLDWPALVDRYLALVERTRTAEEFNRVGSLLFGELDGSHLGIYGGDSFSAPGPDTGYLGVDVEPAPGGFRVTEVIRGGPADQETSRIAEGETIVELEGESLAEGDALPEHDLYRHLSDTRGKELLIGVRGAEGELRRFLITPTSWGAENTLRYEHGTLERRALVEELSGGRLGYLHIRGMSQSYVRDFERDLYAAAHGKEGLLIDVRDNGGGSTTDILLASLTAPNHAFTVPRGADFETTPRDAYPRDRRLIYGYSRPIAVLINENSFSNAEIFAHSIKTTGRGPLIGTQTFGGVISTGAATLIDGTRVRRPFRGWYLPDGTDMEHNGALPDVPVPQTPADDAAGVDRQLEVAVETLLEDLGAGR